MLRRHVADTLVAAVAGARTTEGRALRKVLPRISVADAAGMLAAVVRHTEIDDIHTRSCTTPSSVTVPTALVLAGEYDSVRCRHRGERDLGRHRADDAARRRHRRRAHSLSRAVADLFHRAAGHGRDRVAHAASQRGADRARAVARADAVGRTLRPLPRRAARPLGDPGDGGGERHPRGAGREGRRRRRSGAARRTVAARRARHRRQGRGADGGPRQRQHLSADDDQAVLLGQAGDRRDRGVDDDHRRRRVAGCDHAKSSCACRRPTPA